MACYWALPSNRRRWSTQLRMPAGTISRTNFAHTMRGITDARYKVGMASLRRALDLETSMHRFVSRSRSTRTADVCLCLQSTAAGGLRMTWALL